MHICFSLLKETSNIKVSMFIDESTCLLRKLPLMFNKFHFTHNQELPFVLSQKMNFFGSQVLKCHQVSHYTDFHIILNEYSVLIGKGKAERTVVDADECSSQSDTRMIPKYIIKKSYSLSSNAEINISWSISCDCLCSFESERLCLLNLYKSLQDISAIGRSGNTGEPGATFSFQPCSARNKLML